MEFSDHGGQFRTRHFSTAPGIPGISLNIPTGALPWFSLNIARGETLMFSHLPGDLPAEASHEKEYCRQEGLKSLISLPLQVAGSVLGVINFTTMREHVDWSRYPVPRLSLVAEIFANALMRRRAEESLQEAELRYRIVADFTYDWEYWENPDGSMRYVSPACERISGHPAEEFLARPQLFREIILPEERKIWDDHQEDIRQLPAPRELYFRLLRPDGDVRWIEHACQPVHSNRGEFLGFRASNRDITARKQTEIQEQQHREELARVGRVAILSELTGTLAHEIIQPLMAIMSNSQAARRLLENPAPDLAEVKEALEDITRGSERASGVIQQLRQHLKPGPPEFARLNLNDLVQNLIPLVSRRAASNNINLRCDLAKDLPPVAGNRIQLEQVILNLVVNAIEAIKGSADGPREIVLQTARENPDTLRVSVMDSGSGVNPEDLKLLFDPFFTTKKEGLGLGLSISRSIIKAHQGRLWVAPNPGRGTVLHFTLPVSEENQ